jgi:hypothetical protein
MSPGVCVFACVWGFQQWKTINMPQLELGKHNFENLNTIVDTMPGLSDADRASFKTKVRSPIARLAPGTTPLVRCTASYLVSCSVPCVVCVVLKIVDTETYLRFQYKRDAHAVWDTDGGHAAHLDPNFNRQMAFTQVPGTKQPPSSWNRVEVEPLAAEADFVVVSVHCLEARMLVPDLLSRLPADNADLKLRLETCGDNVLRFMGHQLRAAACQQEIKLCEARVAADPTFMHIVVDFKVRAGLFCCEAFGCVAVCPPYLPPAIPPSLSQMKFNPEYFRETQQQFFGKRG